METFYDIRLTKEEFEAVHDAITFRREAFQKSFGRAAQRAPADKALLKVLSKFLDAEYEASKVYYLEETLL